MSLNQSSNVERVAEYCPGGFHPVLLNDTFKNGRYTVINKLGYGTFATVWLATDAVLSKHVSLKILAANASASELEVLRHLQAAKDLSAGSEYVMQVLDLFTHIGPNGSTLR